jgi:hypothetical protein
VGERVRELHVVAVSEDGRHVLLAGKRDATQGGFRVALNDRLAAALKGDLPSPGQEAPHSSDLTPKEIQSRLRTGESAEAIALAAGVPVARVERFSGPVQGEMARMIDATRSAYLVRGRLGLSAVSLGEAVDLAIDGAPSVREDSSEWTTHREEEGTWLVKVTWYARKRSREAAWRYNPATRTVIAADPASAAMAHVDARAAEKPARRRPAAAPAKKTVAKAATVKKAPAKAAPAKRAVAKVAPAKRAVAKAAPAKKAVAKVAPAKKTVAKAAPAKKAPAKAAPAKRTVAKAAPAKQTAKRAVAKAAPAKQAATKTIAKAAPARRAVATKVPIVQTPVSKVPTRTAAPAKATAAKKASTRRAPVKRSAKTVPQAPARRPARALSVVPDPAPSASTSSAAKSTKRPTAAERDGVKTRATVPGWADVLLGTSPGSDR